MISKRISEKLAQGGGIRAAYHEAQRQYEMYGQENVFDLSIGNPGAPVPEKVHETMVRLAADEELTHSYMCEAGYETTRTKIAESLNLRLQTEYTGDHIIMTNGVAGGLNCTLCAVLDPGDEVIVFQPYYPAYQGFIENWNGKMVTAVPMEEDFTPDFEDLEDKITEKTKAVIINSPHNPSGTIYTEETAEKLTDILRRRQEEYGHEIYLVSDEPYRDLVYDKTKLPWWPEYYGNTIVVYSFSKSLSLAGERVGYVLVPPEMRDAGLLIRAIRLAMGKIGYVNAPAFFQRVIEACIDESVDLEYYDRNRRLLYGTLKRLGFQAVEPRGAFYIFVKSPLEREEDFLKLANRRHIIAVGGSSFGWYGYVRLSFCCTYEVLERSIPAFERLAEDCGLS